MTTRKEFFTLQSVPAALEMLFQQVQPLTRHERLPVMQSNGRILAEPLYSALDLPAFTRSAMDGYAVRAADTYGASSSLPAYLTVVGQVSMGEVPDFAIHSGEAAVIHTGAMLPAGADAVVMIERTQMISGHEIEVLAPAAPGEHVVQIGEDIQKDAAILPAGHLLRPHDIGSLLAAGIQHVSVGSRPRVAILSSGDELVDALETPTLAQIRDINLPMLALLCEQAGAETQALGIARDTLESLLEKARSGLQTADLLLLTAGSSVSARDLTAEVIDQLGEPGILLHGLAVKPGKPTLVAACDGKPVIGLPGNPVSAMLVARQIVLPTLRYLSGERAPLPVSLRASLTQNVASAAGREDTIPVIVCEENGCYYAEPIFGKSNLIFTLLKADGVISIPLNAGGLRAGTDVEVQLF